MPSWIWVGSPMPCLSGTYDPKVGILLQVKILPGGAVQAAHRQARTTGNEQAQLTGAGAQALVDTGASRTSISPQLAEHLEIPPRGKISVQGATGAMPVNSYHVDLMLGFGPQSIVAPSLDVCEFDPGSAPFQVLIGRDILCRGVLTMDFDGHFTFSL